MLIKYIPRRLFFLTASLVLAAFILPALAQDAKRGGTLVLAVTGTPRTLNGAIQSGTATGIPSTQLFASPLRYDDKWTPHPYLAESWKLAGDGMSLTLHLRKNAVFHDGKPITSEDVAFSIMAIKANHPFKTMMGPVTAVETPDPYTAIIRMSEPHPAILLAMSPALCPILPKHIYGVGDLKANPRNNKDVVGSGPFKLVEFTPSNRVVLERFDKFFLPGKPYVDKIVISYISDEMTGMLNIQRGEAQMLPLLGLPNILERLSKDRNVTLLDKGYEGFGGITYLAFNLTRKPFSDRAVRKAMAMAVDKQFIVKALEGGFGRIVDGPIEPSSPLATNDLVTYPYSLKKAAADLDAAGYPVNANGERFKFVLDYIPGFTSWSKNTAEYLRAQFKKVNITVEIRGEPDFPTWANRMGSHDFDASIDGTFNWGDPTIGIDRLYLSNNIKPIVWSNTTSYVNPKVDELLARAAREPDGAKRKADYAAFEKIITDDLPMIFLTTQPYRTAVSKTLSNPPISIWGVLSPFDEIYFK